MKRLALFGLCTTGLFAACSDNTDPTRDGPAIEVVGGNNQQTLVGDPLALPLTIRVQNNGKPVLGQVVTWVVVTGAGTLPASSVTDTLGFSRVTLTTTAAGAQRVTAQLASGDPVTFDATAVPNKAPTEVAVIPAQSGHFIHDTFVRDGILFACSWNNGLILYDVGNGVKGGSPTNPKEISRIITSANGVPGGPQVHNAWWFHNPNGNQKRYVFIGQEGPAIIGGATSGDIHVVDISDLTAPVEVAFLNVPGAGTHNFWMDEARQVLYAAYYNAGVVAVDVSGTLSGNLASRIIQQVRPGGPNGTFTWGVQLAGGSVWSIDMLSGLWKLDPVTLATRGGGNNVPGRLSSDFWVRGSFAYTGTFPGRGFVGDQINVWQVDGANPALRDSVRLTGVNLVSDLQVSEDGQLLVATAQSAAASGLWVYSLADPLRPVIVGRTVSPVNLHTGTLAEIGGKRYVFAARVGNNPAVQIWDVTP